MSFSATGTSPKPSAASDRLRPPGCAPARVHGVEGDPALNSRKDKTMTTLMQASRQWASRPADERYASLLDMQSTMTRRRERSRATVEAPGLLCATRVWLPQQVRVQRAGFSVADSVDEPELRPKADTGAQARRGESLRPL
jgi:hypothetical protein